MDKIKGGYDQSTQEQNLVASWILPVRSYNTLILCKVVVDLW